LFWKIWQRQRKPFLSSLDWTNPGSWASWSGEKLFRVSTLSILFPDLEISLQKARRVDIRLP
jgi:hypothetical protein